MNVGAQTQTAQCIDAVADDIFSLQLNEVVDGALFLSGWAKAVYCELRNCYTHDAWGNVLSTTGSMAGTLGANNPLRYRGYVYDRETGLYYLQSRYYDPEMGRFMNADSLVSTGQGLLGNNMFAYCRNNPICRIDAYGMADATCVNQDGNNNWEPFDDAGRSGGGSLWSTFMGTLDALANGFNMAAGGGRSNLPAQKHHVVPHSNKKYSPEYKEICDRYNYMLDHENNIVMLNGHRGRHTDDYHIFIYCVLAEMDTIIQGADDGLDEVTEFLNGIDILKDYLTEHPELPYARLA